MDFSDGTSVLYEAHLLFASRNVVGNRVFEDVFADDDTLQSPDKSNDVKP